MPALLTSSDATQLARARTPDWRRRPAQWAIFAVGLIVFVVLVSVSPTVTCTETSPCRPDPLSSIGAGLVIGSLFVAFIALWAAGVTAAVAAVFSAWWDGLHPDLAFPAGTIGLVGFAFAALALAWWGEGNPGTTLVDEWSGRVGRLSPPHAKVPKAGRLARLAGVVLLLAGGGCAWYGIERQRQADAQQHAASVVVARVERHVDGFTVRVSRDDGGATTIGVADAADYPVGQQVRLAVDDMGLAQPLAEPYDASAWHLVAAMAVVFGAALVLRGWRRQSRLRALAREPQPAATAMMYEDHIFAGDARAGDLPIARVEIRGFAPLYRHPEWTDQAGETDGIDQTEETGDEADAPEPPTLVTIYGSPVVGAEALVVYDELLFRVRLKPPGMHGLLPADGLPASSVDPKFLPAAEVAAPTEATHVHRKNPLLGYALAAAMPLAAIHVFRLLDPGPLAWLLAIVLACVAGWVSWRLWIRPVLAWNAGGVVVVGVVGCRRMTWPEVKQVTTEGESVVILPHDGAGLVLAAQRKRGGRTAVSVRDGLEYARARYAPSVEPPPLPGSAAAWPLVPLLAGVAWFLVWWASL